MQDSMLWSLVIPAHHVWFYCCWMRSQQHSSTSRLDYCNAVLAGSPTVTTDKLQGVMSLTLGSSMAACRGYCTTNSTGSMSPTEYNSSSPCWCTDVFMEQLRCTWWKVAHKQPTSSVVNTCGPPVSGRWSFCVIDWSHGLGRRCFAVAGTSTCKMEFAVRQCS